ncbi:MAG: SPOR domain-containing protein [Gemmatimonadota bacterium]
MADDSSVRDAAHWLPDDASIVALVRQRAGGAWAAGVAVGLADIVGRRRGRTFLANTVPGTSELDGLMEAADQPGLTLALSGERAMSEIARSAPQQSFAYLPAGEPALSLSQLREIPAFGALLKRVSERGGTLLLYVAEEDLGETRPDPDLDLPVDGCIAIGEIEDLALVVGAPLLARVERPPGDRTATADSGDPTALVEGFDAGSGGAEATASSVETRDAKAPVRRVPAWAPRLGVAAGLLVAWLAWGSLARSGSGGIDEPGGVPVERMADPGDVGVKGTDPSEVSAGEVDSSGAMDADSRSDAPVMATFSGPELPYSVLVASFARPEDAERQMRELDQDAALFLVAPTPIRDRTYYRILAGALEDRVTAEALMQELVEAGLKQEVRGWDVRPVPFAFDLGIYGDRRSADQRIGQLSDLGISAYRIADGLEEPRSWRVYSGAFESEPAAAVYGRILTEVGESAILVPRTGRPR